MKNLTIALVTSVCVLLSLQVSAEQVVAVANLEQAIENTDLAKSKLQSLENNSEYKTLKAKYKSLETEIKQLIDEGNSKGLTWSEERKIEQRNKIEYLSSDLKLARNKIASVRNKELQVISQTYTTNVVAKAIDQVMSLKKVNVILNARAVLGADESLNVTADLTEQLNKTK